MSEKISVTDRCAKQTRLRSRDFVDDLLTTGDLTPCPPRTGTPKTRLRVSQRVIPDFVATADDFAGKLRVRPDFLADHEENCFRLITI